MSAARFGEARQLAIDNLKIGGDPIKAQAAATLALAEAILDGLGEVADALGKIDLSLSHVADEIGLSGGSR